MMEIFFVELANDVDQPAFQHAIKKRSGSLTALERMQITTLRKTSRGLIMAADMSGDESDSSSCSGGCLVSSSSSSSGDTDIIIAACLQQRVRNMCRISRITMLKIRARVVTVDRLDDDWAWRNLRFRKRDLPQLIRELNIPVLFRVDNGKESFHFISEEDGIPRSGN